MRILMYFFLATLALSCAPIYLPNSRNVPLLEKKGEVQGHFSFVSGYNLQAAVAVTDHIAIMGNGLYSDSRNGSNGNVNRYIFGEFGVGYFNNKGKYYFDIFGGYGAGKSSSTDSVFAIHPVTISGYDSHISTGYYNRYFIQPSFGMKWKHFQGAIAYRLSLMDFNKGEKNGITFNLNRNPVVFFEPAIVLKFPFENLVLNVQAGLSTPMNKADLYFDYIPLTVSTGIGFRLGYQPQQ